MRRHTSRWTGVALLLAAVLLGGCGGKQSVSASATRVEAVQLLLAQLSTATVADDPAAVAAAWKADLRDRTRQRVADGLAANPWDRLALELTGLRVADGVLLAQVHWQGTLARPAADEATRRSGQLVLELADGTPPRILALSGDDPFVWMPPEPAVSLP